jgi:microcystin-dependent protein
MDVFIGSLMLVPYNFAPLNFALCQGQLLSIASNSALFSLIGTYYGGNGTTNFALPNLQGCVAVGQGQGPGLQAYVLGETGGQAAVNLTTQTTPPHNHGVFATGAPASQTSPSGNSLANALVYVNDPSPAAQLDARVVSQAGGNAPHPNMMPYTGLNWIICLQGIYPSRP